MLQMMYRFFQLRRATVQNQDKALLRAKLIAVAVSRATHYERALQAYPTSIVGADCRLRRLSTPRPAPALPVRAADLRLTPIV